MKLEGSCHCGGVGFSVDSKSPQPYQRCYCSICRKAGGAGGFAINLLADNNTMVIAGKENLAVYRALKNGAPSRHHRYFCKLCGSHLWAWNEAWPDLVHPLASVIDTKLPKPDRFVDIMLDSAASWVALHTGDHIERFDAYPEASIEAWHKRHGLWLE